MLAGRLCSQSVKERIQQEDSEKGNKGSNTGRLEEAEDNHLKGESTRKIALGLNDADIC